MLARAESQSVWHRLFLIPSLAELALQWPDMVSKQRQDDDQRGGLPSPGRLQSEPYRLFFPLGLGLGTVGVVYWLAFGLGWTEQYRSISHAMTQMQGFVMCIATGFLFTMLPRRTQSAPPTRAELALAAVAPTLLAVFAFLESWIAAQLAFLALCALLLRFLASRIGKGPSRRPPNAFVWLPVAFVFALIGAVVGGLAAAVGRMALHDWGTRLVLQGSPLCLFVGASSLVVPLMTARRPPADGFSSASDRREIAAHLLGACVLLSSFAVELYSPRWGYALRALPIWVHLLAVVKIWRLPRAAGISRWLIWLASWCVPGGLTMAALFRPLGKGALHITFIGGFFLLLVAVSSRVVLGHGGEPERKQRWLAPVVPGTVVALVARLAVELDPTRARLWLAIAASALLVSIAAWALTVLPTLLRRPAG